MTISIRMSFASSTNSNLHYSWGDTFQETFQVQGHFTDLKGDSAFPWISAQPLSETLLNIYTTFYMSVITYLDMLP